MMRFTICFLLLGALGCGPKFSALTTPPPTQTAQLDAKKNHIRLSKGVAIAIQCYDSGPCRKLRATVADPGIAKVFRSHLNSLGQNFMRGPQPESTFVVVGVKAGRTRIRVQTKHGTKTLKVTVLDRAPGTVSLAW